MHRNPVLTRLLAVLLIVVCLCSCGENTTESAETSNLFEYALEIEDGVFSPRQVDFFMSAEEVLRAAGLEEYTVIEKDGGDLIKTSVNIAGFSSDITMYYVFDDAIGNLLCGVRYYLKIVDETATADVYDLLYEQAVSAMPDAPGNAIEGIKSGKDVAWEDKEQNYVWLTFFHNKNSGSGTESEIITLQIVATSNASFVPEELKDILENSMLERSNQERQ